MQIQPQLRLVQSVRRVYAAPIIAAGIFGTGNHLWSGVVNGLARERSRHYKAALDAFFQRLRASGVETEIPYRPDGRQRFTDVVSDVCIQYAAEWGEAGFVVGLAVGTQLGPHALTSERP